MQPDWTKITQTQHQQHSSDINVNKKQIYWSIKVLLPTDAQENCFKRN